MPGGVSPSGLDAGAPPVDSVLRGPVWPCGCVTLLTAGPIDWSFELDCEKTAGEPNNKNVAAANVMVLLHIGALQGPYSGLHRTAGFFASHDYARRHSRHDNNAEPELKFIM